MRFTWRGRPALAFAARAAESGAARAADARAGRPRHKIHDMNRPSFPRTVIAAITFGLLLLNGCTVGPDYHPPKPDAPPAWAGTHVDVTAATQPSTNPATKPSVAT